MATQSGQNLSCCWHQQLAMMIEKKIGNVKGEYLKKE
jgi:hypothetical protein